MLINGSWKSIEYIMKTKIVAVSLALFMFPAAAQKTPQWHTQCRFSDGNTIRIAYSSDQAETRLRTGDLVAVTGIDVPRGDYVVSTSQDSHGNWTLTMKKEARANRGSSPLPPVPMSVTTSASPIESFKVSFDHTGGSCKMLWALEKSNLVLCCSLEFSERNTDIPVLSFRQRQGPERQKFTVVGATSAK